jgi:hypothetical protein
MSVLAQWSPTTPGVFSTSTFDGKVSLCNVLECTAGSSVETFNADFSVTSAVGACTRVLVQLDTAAPLRAVRSAISLYCIRTCCRR